VYIEVHEDSSIESTHKLSSELEFTKRSNIGIDYWLYTNRQMQNLFAFPLGTQGWQQYSVNINLIDQIWEDKPSIPQSEVYMYDDSYNGKSLSEKLSTLNIKDGEALLLNEPDIICWLLNIRGSDVPFTPLILSRAIIDSSHTIHIFTNNNHFPSSKKIKVYAMSELASQLSQYSKIQVDADKTVIALMEIIGDKAILTKDNLHLSRACKNTIEIEHIKRIHISDGLAVSKFLYYLDSHKNLSEIDVELKLKEFRAESPGFIYPSFATIAGWNENGAIVHYRATPRTNKQINGDGILLVDSGGQYMGGTTDITRTIAIGEPTLLQKRNYTAVLKGHINLAAARFPKGTTGHQLDALARYYLWQYGLDYDHGTGHGVGNFLSVHEGPQGISKGLNNTPLRPGMILSNEPGFYKDGEYGIRIENLMVVKEDNEGFLYFETLTIAPLDYKLISHDDLTSKEHEWLRNYHQHILNTLSPLIKDVNFLSWLEKQCTIYL
jgi:Xaa-Pro aminopeptidase